MPWVYARRAIAQSWGVPPWAVDESPYDEVLLELEILKIEGEAEQQQVKRG